VELLLWWSKLYTYMWSRALDGISYKECEMSRTVQKYIRIAGMFFLAFLYCIRWVFQNLTSFPSL
jgi:hypothetical protein